MKWFDKWFLNKSRWAWEYANEEADDTEGLIPVSSNRKRARASLVSTISRDSERPELESQPMYLKVYRANGGTIVETRQYDRRKDENNTQLHVVTCDQDLGDALSKIITIESLRN
jgi:hypothetical protein